MYVDSKDQLISKSI